MNLQILNQVVQEQFEIITPLINEVFDQTKRGIESHGSSVNLRSFINRINQALKGTRITVVREQTERFGLPEDTQGKYYPAIGGYCFEPSNPNNFARIKIIVCVHPKTNRLPLQVDAWEFFRYRFLKCISHELVHRAQFKNGRHIQNALIFRPHSMPNLPKAALQEQTYLGDMDEVEAYARDCVEEWYYMYPQVPLSLRGIKSEFRNNRKSLPSIEYYREAFFGDENHPSVQRFFRKIKKWNELVCPISLSLPRPPLYVRRNKGKNRDVRLG